MGGNGWGAKTPYGNGGVIEQNQVGNSGGPEVGVGALGGAVSAGRGRCIELGGTEAMEIRYLLKGVLHG